MSDHQHESYEVYGLDGTRQDAREALALAAGLREDLAAAEDRIRNLEAECGRELRKLWAAVTALEKQTPQARQLEYEADLALADAAEHDRHGRGCQCPYCYVPHDDYELHGETGGNP